MARRAAGTRTTIRCERAAMNAPSPDQEDAWEMARLLRGQGAALDRLMERHGEKLFHYLVRSLGNEEDAADLAQEAFARVYLHRARFDPAQRFTTWLYAIASNLVRDRYRWRTRHPQVSLDAEGAESGTGLGETLPAADPLPGDDLQREERAELVRRAVTGLPPELRQPLVLAVYDELPQGEIAAILNCSIKAVETRIYRARQHLRAALGGLLPEE